MSKAQTCPVCMGRGKLSDREPFSRTLEKRDKTCHGCGGKGWITVQD